MSTVAKPPINPQMQLSRLGSDALTALLYRFPRERDGRQIESVKVEVFFQPEPGSNVRGSLSEVRK